MGICIQEPPGLTVAEGGSTRHPDSFSPPKGWFQSVTPRGSGRSCLSSPLAPQPLPPPQHLHCPSLVLEWELCSPLLSPHPSNVSLSGLIRSEMPRELFCSKRLLCEDVPQAASGSKCPKLNSLPPQPGLLPSGQEYNCPLWLSFQRLYSSLSSSHVPPNPSSTAVDRSLKYVSQIVWLF